MDPSLWHLLQTSDTAFPVGGFAHSFGLEGLVLAGEIERPAQLESFIAETWIPMLAHVDLPLVRLARAQVNDTAALRRLDELAWACRPTSEARKAQQQMGRKRLATLADVTGDATLRRLHEDAEADRWMANWPVVCGVESAVLEVPLANASISYAYQSMAGLLAASSKLIPIGPAEIQRILGRQQEACHNAVRIAEGIEEADIGWFTPMLDIAGAQHETAYTRIFIS